MDLRRLADFEREQYLNQLYTAINRATQLGLDDCGLFSQISNLMRFFKEGEICGEFIPEIYLSQQHTSGGILKNPIDNLIGKKEYIERKLKILPSLDSCVDNFFIQIENDENIDEIKHQLQKIKFYHDLELKTIPSMYEFIHKKETGHDYDTHTIAFKGFDIGKMCFLFYRLEIFQKGNSSAIRNNVVSEDLKSQVIRNLGQATPEVFTAVNQMRGFALYSVERIRAGPFYHPLAFNHKEIDDVFDQTRSEDPYIFVVEEQLSEDAETYLTSDIETASHKSHKREFIPDVKYKRHFITDSQDTLEVANRNLRSNQYVSKFYVGGSI
jgi:hypothetical protein